MSNRKYECYKSAGGHRVPGVYQRDGNLHIGYSGPSEEVDGKNRRRWRWEKVPSGKLWDAKRLLVQRRQEVQEGRHSLREEHTFGELAKRYIGGLTVKERSRKKYEQIIRKHLMPRLGQVKVKDLDPETLEALHADLLKAYAPATVRQIWGRLTACLRRAVRWRWIVRNPTEGLDLRYPPTARAQRPLKAEEARGFLLWIGEHAPEWHAFYTFALTTGMRQMELLAAKWEYLDEAARVYVVHENLTRQGEFEAPKRPWHIAPVSLTKNLLDVLRQHRAKETLRLGRSPELIFSGKKGQPLCCRSLVKYFKRFLSGAGIAERRFHDLRHSTASIMISRKATVVEVAGQLRHRDPGITLSVYSHLFEADRAASVDALGEAISG